MIPTPYPLPPENEPATDGQVTAISAAIDRLREALQMFRDPDGTTEQPGNRHPYDAAWDLIEIAAEDLQDLR